MAQVFRPRANTIARGSIVTLLLLIGAVGWMVWGLSRSSYATGVWVAREQPVPFSHQHHVAGLGIDCRYCHTSVEDSSFAGLPATSTCMNCHSQVWSDAPMLAAVRESARSGQPLVWTRVHDLPDHVYFHHGIHISKGIGCSTCHGRVDQMQLMMKSEALFMKWCLDCHREPERFIRPREKIFDMAYQPPANQLELGRELVTRYNVNKVGLTNCSVCHR